MAISTVRIAMAERRSLFLAYTLKGLYALVAAYLHDHPSDGVVCDRVWCKKANVLKSRHKRGPRAMLRSGHVRGPNPFPFVVACLSGWLNRPQP